MIKVDSQRFSREVREALEIQKSQSGPNDGGINKDDGKHVKTKFWLPMLQHLKNKENREPEIRLHRRTRRQGQQQLQEQHRSTDLTSNSSSFNVTSNTAGGEAIAVSSDS